MPTNIIDKWGGIPTNEWRNDINIPRHEAHNDWEYKFTCDPALCNDHDTYREAIDSFNEFVRTFYARYYGCGNSMPWFRGQANKNWLVLPTALREDALQTLYSQPIQETIPLSDRLMRHERLLMMRFTREAAILNPEASSAMEWYMLAQHYGMPTRLLDWSSSPLVALWMAVVHSADDEDGMLIALHPNARIDSPYYNNRIYWSQEKQETLIRYLMGDDFSSPEANIDIRDMLNHECIVPIYPKLFNVRLSHQRAYFTLHTPAALSETKPASIGISDIYDYDVYTIKKEHKPYFRTFLLAMGIQCWHIMPDLAHIAQGVRDANFVSRK